MRKGGRLRSFTVDENGALLEKEVFLNETPEAVRTAIKARVGTGEIEEIDKQFEDGQISYEIDFTNASHERIFKVDEAGKLQDLQVFLAETPSPVQVAIAKALQGGVLGDITQVFEDGDVSYEVDINPDAQSRTVTIDPQGAVLSVEMALAISETPEPVQKAIRDPAKDQRTGAIVKTTEDGEVTFDVDFVQGGRWKTVNLGADGQVVP